MIFCFLIFSLRSFSCFSDTLQRSGGGRQPGENQSLLSPDLHYNRCNLPKHIEIFRKEVNIFGKCLLLFTRILTSFGANASFFPKKQRCNRLKKSGFPVEKAFDCALFLLLSPEYEKGL